MPTLADALGALVADMCRARLAADLETVRLAKLYQEHELLQHFAVPRFRLPTVNLELPVVVSGVVGSATTRTIPQEVYPTIEKELFTQVENLLRANLEPEGPTKTTTARLSTATFAAATIDPNLLEAFEATINRRRLAGAERALSETLSKWSTTLTEPIDLDQALGQLFPLVSRVYGETPETLDAVETVLATFVQQSPIAPGTVELSLLTQDIKAVQDPAYITKVRVAISEEGVEWTTIEQGDGTVNQRLQVE